MKLNFASFFKVVSMKIREIELCHATLFEIDFTEKIVKLKYATFFKVVFTEKLLQSNYATFLEIDFTEN